MMHEVEKSLRHNSNEASEQRRATGRGAGGAKGGGREKRRTAKHVPGSEPGKRVTGAVRQRQAIVVKYPR